MTDNTRDFSKIWDVSFRIDHAGGPDKGEVEIFRGVPAICALDLIAFATLMETVDEKQLDAASFTKMIELILDEDSATRFITRMGSKTDPISLTQLMEVLPFLMESYGMRPTKSADPSSGSEPNPESGTSSTLPVSWEQVSTSAPSLAPVS